MAQLTIYLNNADVPRVVQAFEQRYGPKDVHETNAEFVRRHIQEHINTFVRGETLNRAQTQALATYIDLDWAEGV